MSSQEFHIALSHGVLAGTSVYCLIQIKNMDPFCPHVTYGLMAGNSILAILWWVNNYDSRIARMMKFTSYCQLLFALPCITTTVWLQNGYSRDWSWAWAVVPVFPFLCYLVNADLDMPLADILILCNIVGLGIASFVKELNYGIAAAVAYAIAHMFGRKEDLRLSALYNYILCGFAFFSMRALGFGKDIL